MSQTRIKPMVESGILSAVAILFAVISAYVPVLGNFVNIIWPVPLILLGVRHGVKWSSMAAIVAGLVIAMLLHPLHAISVIVGFSLTGIVLGLCIRNGFSNLKTLGLGSVAALISNVAVIALGIAIQGINPLELQMDMMGKSIEQVIEIYRGFGMKEEDLAELSQMMLLSINMMRIIVPVILAAVAAIQTWVNFTVARMVLRRLGHQFQPVTPFKYWSVPYSTIYVWSIASGLMLLANAYQYELISKIMLNILIFTSIVLFFHGLAFFYFLAEKYNLSRFVRNCILVIVLFNGIIAMFVIFAGVYDLIFDYRKLRESRPT